MDLELVAVGQVFEPLDAKGRAKRNPVCFDVVELGVELDNRIHVFVVEERGCDVEMMAPVSNPSGTNRKMAADIVLLKSLECFRVIDVYALDW